MRIRDQMPGADIPTLSLTAFAQSDTQNTDIISSTYTAPISFFHVGCDTPGASDELSYNTPNS